MITCPSCGQENPGGFKFCGACGSPLAAAEPPPEEERKVITALFTDIVGSTARAETMDPEDVRAMLAPYYERVRSELESFGGSVEKFIGDAVVALFGAPVAHEDDPERAVRAALAITAAVAGLNAEHEWLNLHIRTAVNTGEAFVVVGARAAEGEGMAAGDVMNTAARLQGAAPVDGVAVGEATYRATAHLFEFEEAEPIAAKGKAQPVPVWIVVGEKARGRPEPWRPLVGRSRELERLTEIWSRASAESRPQLVNVVGAAGIGKSRLLVELCQRIGPRANTYWGRCLPYGEGITYWPVVEIIRDAAEIRHDDDAPKLSRKLGALLESLATQDRDELRTMAAAAANLVGAATTPQGTYEAGDIGQAELHWGIRRIVQLLALRSPLLLVFEDLHWAEPTLLELLLSMCDEMSPLTIVGTARPEFADANAAFTGEEDNRHLIALEPLGQEESEQLLGELVGAADVDLARLRLLLDNAAGNPLFLEETVRMLSNADLLKPGAALESIPVPETLQALIGSRLDSLAGADKRVAQQASVVGSVFWLGAVAHLAGSNGDLEPRLQTLERRDFVHAHPESTVAGDREFAFKHILIRDVAYERLPKGRRAELHVLFSEWLTAVAGAGDDFVEIHAYHLEQACRLAREVVRSPIEPPVLAAIDALKRSAEKAKRREGMREADRFYERALGLAGDDHPEQSVEIRLGRSRALDALGDPRGARAGYEDVARSSLELGLRDLRCAALLFLANSDQRQGLAVEARTRLTEAKTLATELGERPLQIRALFESANLRAWFEADPDGAAESLREAIELTDALGDLALRIEARMRLGSVLFNVGDLAGAERELNDAAKLAGATGSFRDDARISSLLAYVTYFRDLEEAERLALQALEWLERTSDSYLQLQNLRVLAKCALRRGDPVVAEEHLQRALPLALEGGGWVLSEVYRYLAEALVVHGRLDDARELIGFASRSLPEEDPYARAAVLLAEGIVAGAANEPATASTAFTESLGILDENRLVTDLGEARVAFARTLRRLGEVTGARIELERARQIFAGMDAKAFVEEIDAELKELAAGAGVAGPRASS
jgi:class 3 adenylate cyclase/tetratricopeptide (TPR) repeat protein